VRRVLFLSFACALGALVVGCGEEGVSRGATVTVYVSGKSLCEGARQELDRSGGRAGDFRVRAICLDNPGTLAATGANARRATEDSTTVGYIGEPSTIVDAAGIAQVSTSSGAIAMARLLRAIRQADDSHVRESVFDELEQAR
jgi:hypothetical protein